jgi:N-acetyl-beta-hexosaminidase
MNLYHFHLTDPTGARREMKSIRLNDIAAVWREIEALALSRSADGDQIRVTNEAGGIVVLIGVSTALSLRTPRAA